MSHNLECEGIELLQTPTHITRLCLHGDPSPQQILERYLIWLESCDLVQVKCDEADKAGISEVKVELEILARKVKDRR